MKKRPKTIYKKYTVRLPEQAKTILEKQCDEQNLKQYEFIEEILTQIPSSPTVEAISAMLKKRSSFNEAHTAGNLTKKVQFWIMQNKENSIKQWSSILGLPKGSFLREYIILPELLKTKK